jgi:hypothetical protein
MWVAFAYFCWIVSATLVAWMVYDWIKTDRTYTEAQLTSSREGEIEAISERHDIGGTSR